jgi:anaerobic magnesium-protoporphyrin IX monomethyl ester cyclase
MGISKKVLLVDPVGASYGVSPALAYIGAFLKSKGIETKGLDLNSHHASVADEMAKHTIQEFQPHVIGYSVLYTNYRWLQGHLKRLRNYFDGTIIVGGPQIIIEGKDIFKDMPEVDFACVGEGEYALWEVTKCLENGEPLDRVRGIIFRTGDQVIETTPRMPLKPMDELPFPDFTIFGTHRLPYYPLMTSRGCPFSCKYCFRSVKGDWRPRSPANVIAEIEHAKATYQFKHMVIHDDSFNLKPKRVEEICDLMIDRNIRIPWKCAGIRANLVTDEVCTRMKAAGCIEVAVGIESLVPEVFERIDKKESIDSILEGIQILRRSGLKVVGYFIIGLPEDNYHRTMETFKKAKKIVDGQSWTLMLPIGGTPFWGELHKDDRVRWLHDYRDIDMTWLPRLSQVKTAFETPEYPAKKKVFAYHKINIHLGTPKYRVYPSKLRTLSGIVWLILKHAPWKGTWNLLLVLPGLWRKLLSGRIPLSEDGLYVVQDR